MEADLHAHTRFSDGLLSPAGVVWHARRQRVDVLAVTEHNVLFPARMAAWCSDLLGGPIVVVGEEVTNREAHLVVLGIHRRVSPYGALSEIVEDVHKQGGVVIAAHPVERFHEGLVPVRSRLDGAEIMHPLAYRTNRASWSWPSMQRFFLEAEPQLAPIGSSDYHGFAPLGLVTTWVLAERADERAIVDAIRRRRTAVVDHEGRWYGAELVAEAAADRAELAPSRDFTYAAKNGWDQVFRWLGWLCVLGLVLFRRSTHAESDPEPDRKADRGDGEQP